MESGSDGRNRAISPALGKLALARSDHSQVAGDAMTNRNEINGLNA